MFENTSPLTPQLTHTGSHASLCIPKGRGRIKILQIIYLPIENKIVLCVMLGGFMKKVVYILLVLMILSFGAIKLSQYAQAITLGMN